MAHNSATFNFDDWIDDYKLGDIKKCFVGYEMTTLDTLKADNSNYIKLIGDPRVLQYALLAIHVKIHEGISALNDLLEEIASATNTEEKELCQLQIVSSDEKEATNTAIMVPVYLTEPEIKALSAIEHNIKDLEQKQSKLSDSAALDAQKQENREIMKEYQTKMKGQFTEIMSVIDNVFETLEYEVAKCQTNLDNKMKKHENYIVERERNHNRQTTMIENSIQNCLTRIHQTIEHSANIKKECGSILRAYPNNIGNSNNWKIFGSENKQREDVIVKKCDIAQKEYKIQSDRLSDDINEMYKYMSAELELSDDEHAYPSINQNVYDRICKAANQLLEIADDHDTEEKESEMKQIIELMIDNNKKVTTPQHLIQSKTHTEYKILSSTTPSIASPSSSYMQASVDYVALDNGDEKEKKPMGYKRVKRRSLKIKKGTTKIFGTKNVKKRSKSIHIEEKNAKLLNWPWWGDYVHKEKVWGDNILDESTEHKLLHN